MLSGHIETPEQQMRHLSELRSLQQTALNREYPAGITEFILLPFVGQEAPQTFAPPCGRRSTPLADALLLTAGTDFFKALVPTISPVG